MADFDAPHYRTSPLQAKSSTRRTTGGSNFFRSNFLLRLFFIALFLSVLSQFTSQPPDFISDTVFAKSWELVHLFIIGIIVSYGLFGRRGTQSHMEIQAPPAFNSPNNLHPSTVFNFDHQNPCAYGFHGNANVNEAREYRPFGLEPTVVVRPGTHDLDYKPLDLPVRSLRSRVDEESDGEMCASESEIEAGESSSCCCYEEDNESENLEEDNVANTSSPTPWNWPNVVNPDVKQTGYEMFGPPESESHSMDVGVDNVLASQSVYFGAGLHEVKHVKNVPESPASVEENSRKNVELGSSVEKKTASSLESRSIRVAFKEKVGDVSLQAGAKCQDPRKASSPEYSPSCSDASVEAECLERKSRMQKLQSLSSPKSESVSPLWDFLPPSSPESSLPRSSLSEPLPTTEMDSLQREGKNGENSPEQMREASSFDHANGFPLKRVRSRGRRSRNGDEMKSRTSSLRSESSCDTTFSPSPSSSSQNFTSTTQPKLSPGTGKLKQVEISALEIDPVLPTESSSIQLMADLDKDVIGKSRTLSRTPNSRRFSIGSIFDRELWKGSKVATKETTKKEKDENGGDTSGKCGWDCLKLDMKSTPTKNSLRGKSVRTVRPQAITLEPSCKNEMSPRQKTDERTRERQDLVIISIGISGKNNTYAMNQKCTSTNTKQERAESCSLEPGKNKERLSCVQDVNEDEDCNSEIDRKAGEFIAKFKEQIRLQKGASRRVSGKK